MSMNTTVKRKFSATLLLLGCFATLIMNAQDASSKTDKTLEWCMAPIYDEDEKLHVFMSAIPNGRSKYQSCF